jgi:hypothetical protein
MCWLGLAGGFTHDDVLNTIKNCCDCCNCCELFCYSWLLCNVWLQCVSAGDLSLQTASAAVGGGLRILSFAKPAHDLG